jgi:hypothetical protein
MSNSREEYLAKVRADKKRRTQKGNGTQVRYDFEAPTEAQEKFATELAARAGYRFLSDAAKDCFGRRRVGGLKRGDMSTLIEWLKAKR